MILKEIIELIEDNKISTTEVADALGKVGWLENIHALNCGIFKVGEVAMVYAVNNSNYEVHKQLSEKDVAGKILFVYNVNCDRAIFGDLVSKYVLLYKRAKAIVVNGMLRDAHTLKKEKYPIWLSGVSPIGCVNYPNGDGIAPELLESLRKQYDGAIMVCDDSGVVLIPKHRIENTLVDRLKFIEYQEDIWFYCLDTLKMSTYDIVCNKAYLKDELMDKRLLERLSVFDIKGDSGNVERK